jgi:phosphorylated adapter RNA export protein
MPNESNDKDLSAAEIARRRKRNSKKRERKHRTDEEKITLDIATKLKEPKMQLVRKAVALIGIDAAKRICGEALTVEDVGGMMTLKGNRRRSPGGVFFSLIKADKSISDKQKNDLFFVEPLKLDARKKNLSKKARQKMRKSSAIIKEKTTEAANILETLTIAPALCIAANDFKEPEISIPEVAPVECNNEMMI